MRAYSGINVAQYATVFQEPVFLPGESAINLLTLGPRTAGFDRSPYVWNASSAVPDSSMNSCSVHSNQAG